MSDAGDLEADIVKNFWVRDKARQIGEKAISIFTGESEHFGELKTKTLCNLWKKRLANQISRLLGTC